MTFSRLIFPILVLFAFSSTSLSFSSSSESSSSDEEEAPRRRGRVKTHRTPSDLHQFRQMQLNQSRAVHKAKLSDDHAYKQACLDQSKVSARAAQKLARDQLELEKKREARLAKQARDEERRRKEAEEEKKRERRAQKEKAKTKSHSEDQRLLDNDEAMSFLKAWGKEDPSTLDSFTKRAIVTAKDAKKSHSPLSPDLVKEVLKRKKVILKCVEACKSDLLGYPVNDPRDTEIIRIKEGMRKIIRKGMVGLTYEAARRQLDSM
ncbi:hypothetical protein OAN21_00260 [Alphaproteobacteria bacterium]|nr:hypothetical protein [Alphaproteobacteria bacterium]